MLARLFHELDDRHGGVVAGPRRELDDARVTAWPVAVPLQVGGEEPRADFPVVHKLGNTAACLDIVGLGVGDDAFHPATQLLRLRLGGGDAAVAQQSGDRSEERRVGKEARARWSWCE